MRNGNLRRKKEITEHELNVARHEIISLHEYQNVSSIKREQEQMFTRNDNSVIVFCYIRD